MKILIVEDDLEISKLLADFLQGNGYEVLCQYDGLHVLDCIQEHQIDLILLDIMLPYRSGDTILADIRKFSTIPVIVISAKETTQNKIDLLRLGADDYITKPFNIKIVIQRIKAILRRCEGDDTLDKVLQCGNLAVDFESHTVKKHGKLLTLTPTEFKLLHRFCLNPGQVLTRQILLEKLWDQDGNFVDEHTLTINISRLRAKIADEEYAYIKTIYGVGYKWIGESHE